MRNIKLIIATLMTIALMVGCGRSSKPNWTTRYIEPTHAKPIGDSYYKEWDPYAGTIVLERIEGNGPVNDEQVFIVTVLDKEGEPLENRRVEWILAQGSVGDIIEVDESGIRRSRGYKINNQYAVSHSNNRDHVFDRGTDDPSDDLVLTEGQTWCVLNSPVEGDSHLMVYVPAIHAWNEQRRTIKYHWRDFDHETASAGSACLGSPALLTTRVNRHSDGEPLAGYEVSYQIVEGANARFLENDARQISVFTDEEGVATAQLQQMGGAAVTDNIHVDVIRPGNQACCIEPMHMASSTIDQSWVEPDISLTQKIDETATCGKETTVTLTVANPSECEITDVMVTDQLPEGWQLISSSPEAIRSGERLVWSLGTMASGSEQTIQLNVLSGQGGEFSREIIASSGTDVILERDTGTLQIACPVLALSFEAPEEVMSCDSLPHKLLVRNEGDGELRNVVVEVEIDEGFKPEEGSNIQRFTIESLAAGESKDLSLMVSPTKTGEFRSEVKATADGGFETEAFVAILVNEPDLEIARSGPDKRYLGREADFEITIRNTGDAVARDVVLTESLPAGMEYVKSSDNGRFSEGNIIWNFEELPVGATRTVSHTLKAVQAGAAESEVKASATCADASMQGLLQIEGLAALELEVGDVNDPIEVGKEVEYEIVVTNQGTAQEDGITLVATLPDEMTFVSSDGPTSASSSGQQVRFGVINGLAPKEKASYKLRAKVVRPGDIRFKVTMNIEGSDVPVQETESTFLY